MSFSEDNKNKIWKNLFELIMQNDSCTLKNLNSIDSGKEIYAMKICKTDIIDKLLELQIDNQNIVKPYIDPIGKLIMILIPQSSKFFINLFCCKITMEKIYNKFAKYGLAIEGCFNIEPITMIPTFYQGYEYGTKNMLNMKGENMHTKRSFLVIDNHNIIKIINDDELKLYEPKGVNVQYIEGFRLYENTKPFMDSSTMKNVKVKINGSQNNINGSNVTIDYNKLKIKINDSYYDFNKIGSDVNFVYDTMFNMNEGLFVFAIDMSNNIFMMYHKHIDYYNIMLLLNMFGCKDAILLCNSPNVNIIWKENGYNTYNKTDFVGNPKKILSNVITFSG
jgi:hypothetical protein